MLNYEKLFEPFTSDGCTLEMMISWVQKKTQASNIIMAQGVAEVMNKLAKGEKFNQPSEIQGAPANVHTVISHYLLSTVTDMLLLINQKTVEVIENRQKVLLESQMKQLSNFDKEYNKMINGSLWNRFKKFIGAPYLQWKYEKGK